MSENKKNEQIDDFSKSLLDTKANYDPQSEMPKEHKMTPQERKAAERTMSSALDMLRKERGQKTIEEEEHDFQEQQKKEKEEVDFTTSSIENEQDDSGALNLVHSLLQDMSNDEEDQQEAPKNSALHPKKEENKKQKSKPKAKKQTDGFKKKKEPKKVKKMSQVTKVVLVLCFLGLVALGGYSYKVLIYDPQNIVSTSQQKAYDKLTAYADEYGDNMMSDAEKLELLDLDKGYQKLLDKQKTSISSYFKEQTGKTYKALLKEIKALNTSKEQAKLPAYQQIQDLLNNWDAKSEEERLSIIDLQSTYNGLSKSLRKEIDVLAQAKTGKTFTDLCSEQSQLKQSKEDEQNAKTQENLSQIDEYQKSLDEAKSQYDTYSQYGQSLQENLATAQANGEDTSAIESQISTNNQMLQELQNDIYYYQQQIASLQS